VQAKRSANASCYAVLLSDSVIQHRVLSRELDDLQSGAIRKATVAPGEGGASPAEGDLVRPRTAPLLPIARRLQPTPPCREPLDAPTACARDLVPAPPPRPQVYVHVAVREGERTLATTRADEGGPGVPRALVLGKGRRAPRAWELALLGARPPARGRAHSSALRERQATHVDSAGNPQHPLRRTRMHQVAWHNYAGACRAGCINACL